MQHLFSYLSSLLKLSSDNKVNKLIKKYKAKQQWLRWEGSNPGFLHSSILCKEPTLLLILLTPLLSPVGTGHNAVAHYHSPPVPKLHSSLQPYWGCLTERAGDCVCVSLWVWDTERRPRWECEAVRGKTLKEHQRRSERGEEDGEHSKKAEQSSRKWRGEGREIKSNVNGLSLIVLAPKSRDAMTRWPATAHSILSWSLDRRGQEKSTHTQRQNTLFSQSHIHWIMSSTGSANHNKRLACK